MKTKEQYNTTLPVMEHFYSLQGEGAFSGNAAYFIRLGGCDVGCVWCDVKESWDANIHKKILITDIVDLVQADNSKIAVVTGGEPAMYNLTDLCSLLHKASVRAHIETSGTRIINGKFDWITVSPKKFKPPLKTNLEIADELKVVIYNESDFDWAEKHAKYVPSNCKLYLQPEWSVKEKINPIIIQYIKKNPQWLLSLQIHKYLNIL